MQRTILRAGLGLALVANGCAAPADVDSVLLVNARLIDGTGAAARDAAVRILDGRIAEVGNLTATGFWTSEMGVEDLQYMGNEYVSRWSGCPPEQLRKLGLID